MDFCENFEPWGNCEWMCKTILGSPQVCVYTRFWYFSVRTKSGRTWVSFNPGRTSVSLCRVNRAYIYLLSKQNMREAKPSSLPHPKAFFMHVHASSKSKGLMLVMPTLFPFRKGSMHFITVHLISNKVDTICNTLRFKVNGGDVYFFVIFGEPPVY